MSFSIKSARQVKQFQNREISGRLVFDARWEVEEAPPNTLVGIRAVSRVSIGGGSANIHVYQLLQGQEIPVEVITAELDKGKVAAEWRTRPVKAGNFEEGIYHFKVTVGGYSGETVTGLKLKDAVAKRGQDSFESGAKVKLKVVF